MMTRERAIGFTALFVFGFSVFLANWLILNWGTVVLNDGTHLVPVGFGLHAPSGIYAAGLSLVARDFVQRGLGRSWSLFMLLPGTAATALLSPDLALASATAFFFSEVADFLVYTPLENRAFPVAVAVSGTVGTGIDSVLFLGVAGIPFGIALPGLLLGKLSVQLAGVPVAVWLRGRVLEAPRF